MTLQEAKKIVRDEDASLVDLAHAAAILTSSAASTFEDFVECLRRGGYCAEVGTAALYLRTGRTRVEYEEMEFDPQKWVIYLRQHGFDLTAQSGKDYLID